MLIGANKRTKFLYKRTYFMINKDEYVELVSLSSEIRDCELNNLEGMKVYKTDSREQKLKELNSHVCKKLNTEKVYEEIIELDQVQFEKMAEQTTNLFNHGLN